MLLRFIRLMNLIINDKFPFLLIFILFIFVGLLLVQNYDLRKELLLFGAISSEINNTNIDTNRLYKIINKNLSSIMREKEFKWNLVIIFSPDDCPICIDELSFWDNYARQQKQSFLGCWGLVNYPYPKLVNDFIKNMGWKFPIYVINDSLYTKMSYEKSTPLKILIKGTKNIYYIEGPNPNWHEKSILKNIIFHLK